MASNLHSNAFNFLSFMSHQVDPRTGQYTASVNFPDINANNLCGPALPLNLNFNPLNTLDSGFGVGWSWQLSQYDPATEMLTLSTGEALRVSNWVDAKAEFNEQKLVTFNFYSEGTDTYRIEHKSGLSERLSLYGSLYLPKELYSAQGHKLIFSYTPITANTGVIYALEQVSDAQGTALVSISGLGSSELKILLYSGFNQDSNALSTYEWRSVPGSFETRVTLPTDDHAYWNFTFAKHRNLLCITEVLTPNGSHEFVRYEDGGHGHPAGDEFRIPRVTHHVIKPGAGQDDINYKYTYVLPQKNNQHNFLGYHAPGLVWGNTGYDNLYQVVADYKYGSIQSLLDGNTTVNSVVRTYNRFHLLSREEIQQSGHIQAVETTYHILENALFSAQPDFFQLPHTVTKSWYLTSDKNKIRTETVTTQYDTHGNETSKILADGTTLLSTYYAPTGEGIPTDDFYCPPDPELFVRSLKIKTTIPAPSSFGNAPTLQCQFRYGSLPSIIEGFANHQVLTTEKLFQVTVEQAANGQSKELFLPLQTIERTYYNTLGNLVSHGRLKRQTLTLETSSSFIDFEYGLLSLPETVPVLVTRKTLGSSLDSHYRTTEAHTSIITGQPVFEIQDNGSTVAYTYDSLGRLKSETTSPDTNASATRRYEYYLPTAQGLITEHIITDVMGLKARVKFDGLDRMISQELMDNTNSQNRDYRKTYEALYNNRGHLAQETYYDWIDETNSLALTSHFFYDHWNQLEATKKPDNILYYEVHDPIGLKNTEEQFEPTITRWRQVPSIVAVQHGLNVTRLSSLGKPLKVEMRDSQNAVISYYEYNYDGVGNCIKEVDEFGNTSQYAYDAWSRLVSNTLPDRTRVLHTYTPHSTEALPTRLEVIDGANIKRVIGEQTFDGLGRMTSSSVGSRVQTLSYTDGQMQVCKRETLKKKIISYAYDFNLTSSPRQMISQEGTATFEYHPSSALLTQVTTSEGVRKYVYNQSQQLLKDTWTDTNGTTLQTDYTSTLQGRQLSRTTVVNNISTTNTCDYYADGRLHQMTQGVLKAEYIYDTLGRVSCTTTTDTQSGAVLVTAIEYDQYDQETQRTIILNNQPPRVITQTWGISGLLETRVLEHDGYSLIAERFNYDTRGRLIEHQCQGATLPKDEYGQRIRSQLFFFDALDNITERFTTYDDDTTDDAIFSYQTDDPCQLLSVSHSHQRYIEAGRGLCVFTYDEDGHQRNDEFGNRLEYDSQGRLLNAGNDSSSHSLSHYRYDGHNQLIASTNRDQSECFRMYEGYELVGTLQDEIHTRYFRDADQTLGQQSDDPDQVLLYMCDANKTVIAQSQDQAVKSAVYNAYGDSGDWSLTGSLAFNGEMREQDTGWYLLGKGYRAYNPSLMRFHSPDSLSPFGAGGINPYVYCLGNPIKFSDPTGHYSYYDQSIDRANPVYKQAAPIQGFSLEQGLITAAMMAIGVGVTIATGGTAAPIFIGLSVDLFATSLGTWGLYTRGTLSKNLESSEMLIGFMPLPNSLGKKLVKNTLRGPDVLERAVEASARQRINLLKGRDNPMFIESNPAIKRANSPLQSSPSKRRKIDGAASPDTAPNPSYRAGPDITREMTTDTAIKNTSHQILTPPTPPIQPPSPSLPAITQQTVNASGPKQWPTVTPATRIRGTNGFGQRSDF
ncbi:RHS repeat-associated core domain-containing protein [Pseudomonas helleri]|uniref:Sugar-binding protein n=1 Tax=Pseudomonas helleri TaxID=1608996 RepID=A0A6L5HTR2_9PSED|nr:RHS repeat-associated core domain-containing protein [Pseudomonas helleri]MQU06766.1 hypothetical protein [Pseudomonas helleri]